MPATPTTSVTVPRCAFAAPYPIAGRRSVLTSQNASLASAGGWPADAPAGSADLTQTWLCGIAAIGELRMVHEVSAAVDRELRIVVSSASILHQFALTGLDAELLIYPSLNPASAPGRASSVGRLRWGT